jgi:hypothetical protein
MSLGPGTYIIKLSNGKPALFVTNAAGLLSPIGDPTFDTVGNASFIFTIDETEPLTPPFAFKDPPLTWHDASGQITPEPTGNSFTLDGETILTLNVTAPAEAQTVIFTLQTNNGGIDPTIVEKPADGTTDG